jgi:hypothetical protein
MPRADPTRSAYCASRHLLRNLDDPVELRRNPLVRECFTGPPGRRDASENAHALDRVRGLVHATLALCRQRPSMGRVVSKRAHADPARMHAALLRCEIDRQPLEVVAGELGLSDRQVRRERRAAHDAFLDAFRTTAHETLPRAVTSDLGTLRLDEASELHELGKSALALAACESVAGSAEQAERRIEALCLAAEIDLDAARYEASAARIAQADAILAARRDELGEDVRADAVERIDLAGWALRRATTESGGLAMPPPFAVVQANAYDRHDERRRALLVRALGAYAGQRWDVGDTMRGHEAVRRAHALIRRLDPARTKERLGVMLAHAQLVALRQQGEERELFLAVEEIAQRRRYVRTLLSARAQRIGCELFARGGGTGEFVLERMLEPFDAGERRATPWVLAQAAYIAAACSRDRHERLAAADVTERLSPQRSAMNMIVRGERIRVMIEDRQFEEARAAAQALRGDAQLIGNPRFHGSAARYLAVVALAQHRRADAKRLVGEALPLLEKYGIEFAFNEAFAVAKRLGVA